MNVETVIAIVTAGIAFVTSVATFTYNFIQNRKNRIQKVILDNRVKYMDGIREGFTDLVGLANSGAIKIAKASSDVKKIYCERLFDGYGKLKTYIKPFYKMDGELLVTLDALYARILDALDGEADARELDALRESFADKYLKYDWAYWKYIQSQKEGNYMDSDEAFDNVYYEFVNGLDRAS